MLPKMRPIVFVEEHGNEYTVFPSEEPMAELPGIAEYRCSARSAGARIRDVPVSIMLCPLPNMSVPLRDTPSRRIFHRD